MLVKKEAVGTDGLRVTEDEATELVAHHLRLAIMFFEATPNDFRQTKEEIQTIIIRREDDRAYAASMAFLEAANTYYEGLKKKDL